MFKKVIFCFGFINIGLFLLMFKKPLKKQKQSKYDCAIVCGFPANQDGKPSLIMKSRVEKAVELYRQGKIKYIIFSGADVQNRYKEADVMEKYAFKLGVDKNAIIKESKAKCTYHNLMYASEIMKEKNFNSCLVITNSWHLRKADHYARKFKLKYAMVVACRPKGYGVIRVLWLHISTNLIMYRNMFKGYY